MVNCAAPSRCFRYHSTKFFLAPNLVERTFDIIRQIRAEGGTVIMVEQNAAAALAWRTAMIGNEVV